MIDGFQYAVSMVFSRAGGRDNRGDPKGTAFDIRVKYMKQKPDIVSK
jgi:hypothetical protein